MNSNTESKLRNKLELKYLFLQLVGNLVARGELYDDNSRRIVDETKDFVYHSTSEDFLNRVEDVSNQLDELIADGISLFPVKISTEEVAREFSQLLKEKGEDIYLTGVPFGWLNNLIDCTHLGLPSDLPYHAKIGLWVHGGYFSVEEKFLLDDAFFLLEIADTCYDRMHLAASQFEETELTLDKENHLVLSVANQNVCSTARLCVFSFYAFVEAFVNSVGNDFATRNSSGLTPKDIEILHGTKKQRLLSLEKKMEFFPRIIRQDKTSPIVLTDKKQRKEPFLTFFSNIKNVRDASTHFGVGKASIWRKPKEWLDFAESTSRISIEVASKFWEACYPGKQKPDYLFGLNYDVLRGIARDRSDTTEHILTMKKD